jgi:WD40 repeat protein
MKTPRFALPHFFALVALSVLAALPLCGADAPPRLVVPSSHGAEIKSVISTPDGKWTLSGAVTREVKLWDTASAKEMGLVVAGKDARETLVGLYPRNNKQVYVVTTNTIQLYDVPSLRLATSIDVPREVYNARVSEDGESLFLGGASRRKQYVYVLRRGRFPVRQLFERDIQGDTGIHQGGWHISAHASSDGKYVLYWDTAFHVIDLATNQEVLTLPEKVPGTSSNNFHAGWTPDNLLAHSQVAGNPTTTVIALYDPTTALKVANHVIPNSAWLLNAGVAGMPAIFGGSGHVSFVTAQSVDGPYKTSDGYATAGTFNRGNRFFVSASMESDVEKTNTFQLRSLDLAKGALSDRWSPTNLAAKTFKVSPQGNAVFIGDRSRLAKVIRFEQGTVQVVPITHRVDFDAEFTPDGEKLVVNTGSHDRLQETINARNARVETKNTLPFTSDARSANGRLLMSPSGKYVADFRVYGSRVEIQDVKTGRVVHSFPIGHYSYDEPSLPCAFSPDETSFVFFVYEKDQSQGPGLRCYDLNTGQLRWGRKLRSPIGGVAYAKDGASITVLHAERYPVIWTLNAESGQDARAVVTPLTDIPGSARPALSPDLTLVAYPCGSEVRVLTIATGELKGKLAHNAQNAAHVAFLNDNQLVALSHDGSLRLWGLKRQELLGTMTFSKEGSEWAFVHPSGRFDATAGSQEQMYFAQGAKRVPLSAYFETFYTPGIVNDVLAGAEIQSPTLELKDLTEPPSVTLRLAQSTRNLTVEDAPEQVTTETVTLTVVADSPDSPISEIRVFQNGKRIEAKTRNLVVEDDDGGSDQKPLSAGAKTENVTVTLLPGENVFRAVALNAQRTESLPVELAVEFTPPKEAAAVAGRTGGGLQLHLLIVGINTYRNPKYNLNYAVPDATAVRAALEQTSGKIFSKVNVTTLLNEKATRASLQEAFKGVASASDAKDVFVFYYAGHGVMTAEPKPEFFLVPYEVTQLYGADETLREKALSSAELLAFSQQIAAQKQLFILDACQSAGALQSSPPIRGTARCRRGKGRRATRPRIRDTLDHRIGLGAVCDRVRETRSRHLHVCVAGSVVRQSRQRGWSSHRE